MNFSRPVLNAFSAAEVRRITGLSVHMINYLAREGYLTPTYGHERVRGKVRYYSYRDLVVGRIVQGLLARGLEIRRLKSSIQQLSADSTWFPKGRKSFDLLATDGRKLYYHDRNGSLVELTPSRQRTFAFVLDVEQTQNDIKRKISKAKLERYSIRNRELLYVRDKARHRIS